MERGLLITLEGGEGSGKTTAAALLKARLEAQGYRVLISREPGGSRICESIRTILLDPANTAMSPVCEAALYAASRAQHVAEVILPALQAGTIVICDRYVDSSLVYQGIGRKLGMDTVQNLNAWAMSACMPDLTLYFAIDPQAGLARAKKRGDLNRLDQESLAFHTAIQAGYETLAAMHPGRIKKLDASLDPESVAEHAMMEIERCLDACHAGK